MIDCYLNPVLARCGILSSIRGESLPSLPLSANKEVALKRHSCPHLFMSLLVLFSSSSNRYKPYNAVSGCLRASSIRQTTSSALKQQQFNLQKPYNYSAIPHQAIANNNSIQGFFLIHFKWTRSISIFKANLLIILIQCNNLIISAGSVQILPSFPSLLLHYPMWSLSFYYYKSIKY